MPSSRAKTSAPDAPTDDDCRCLCGALLARRVPGGVELKCRRCKRTIVVPLEPAAPGQREPG